MERKRQEAAAERVAEQEERERKAKDEEKRLEAVVAASKESKADVITDASVEEAKTSNRKDKRDRRDLDEDEVPAKKPKQGNRKRRIEELVDDDLLTVDLNDVKAIEEEPPIIAEEKSPELTPLGLSSPRTRRAKAGKVTKRHKFNAPTEEIKREVELAESVTIQQLSQKMSIKANDVIKTLFSLGIAKTMNETQCEAYGI